MKNDAPKPTPIEVQKCYTLVDSSDICYKIKLTFSSDKLIIDIIQEDSFPKIYYSSFFILEEIQKMINGLDYLILLMNQLIQ